MADYEDPDYSKPVSPAVWKKMAPFIAPQKLNLIRCAVLMLSVAAVDVLLPLLLGYAIRNNIEPRSTQGMGGLLAAAICMIVVQGINVRFFVANGIRAEVGIVRAVRNAVFFHLQKLSLDYYNKTPVGYMMARTHSDTGKIGELVAWGVIDFSWSVFYCVGVIISMFLVHWRLAIIVCATVPPLALFTWFFQKRILEVNRILRRVNSKMTGAMNEGITGARTVKVLVAEEQSLREYSGITGEYRRHANRMARLRSVFIPLVLFIGSAATAVVLGYGGYEIVFLGADLSVLAIFLQYAGGFFDPIQNIANILTEFVSTQANVERVSGLLEQAPMITDSDAVVETYGDTFHPKKENWEPIRGEVEFRDVTFRYPDGGDNVLEHFNLRVEAGSYVAIVGETGA
ncbi:MAG: ABC transporter ATP-binding protein, partial [Treponema sp.]|nr:ABC transporter ATP-binding protein [Treponema sp.]